MPRVVSVWVLIKQLTAILGNNANGLNLTVQNTGWTTSFLLGLAIDIAYPDLCRDADHDGT